MNLFPILFIYLESILVGGLFGFALGKGIITPLVLQARNTKKISYPWFVGSILVFILLGLFLFGIIGASSPFHLYLTIANRSVIAGAIIGLIIGLIPVFKK